MKRMSKAEAAARRAAMMGIPLATAGEVGYAMGGTRWIGDGDSRWFYKGVPINAPMCRGHNVALVAERERGMPRKVFATLWRQVVKDMLRAGAKCVRIKVIGG